MLENSLQAETHGVVEHCQCHIVMKHGGLLEVLFGIVFRLLPFSVTVKINTMFNEWCREQNYLSVVAWSTLQYLVCRRFLTILCSSPFS